MELPLRIWARCWTGTQQRMRQLLLRARVYNLGKNHLPKSDPSIRRESEHFVAGIAAQTVDSVGTGTVRFLECH